LLTPSFMSTNDMQDLMTNVVMFMHGPWTKYYWKIAITLIEVLWASMWSITMTFQIISLGIWIDWMDQIKAHNTFKISPFILFFKPLND
jgi:hypothetical protein